MRCVVSAANKPNSQPRNWFSRHINQDQRSVATAPGKEGSAQEKLDERVFFCEFCLSEVQLHSFSSKSKSNKIGESEIGSSFGDSCESANVDLMRLHKSL
jgi:hypothetical protein